MAGLENLGFGGGSINFLGMAGKLVIVLQWALSVVVFFGIIFFVWFFLQYKYDILIIEPRVHGGIRARKEKAKKIVRGSVVDYELRSSMFKKKINREILASDFAYSIPMGSKDLLVAYRVSEGAFHPVTFQKPNEKDLTANLAVVINKDLVRGIISRFRQTIEKYNENKWYNHPLFMASVFVIVSFIHLIMFLKLLETAGGVGGVCQSAAENIKSSVSQKIG